MFLTPHVTFLAFASFTWSLFLDEIAQEICPFEFVVASLHKLDVIQAFGFVIQASGAIEATLCLEKLQFAIHWLGRIDFWLPICSWLPAINLTICVDVPSVFFFFKINPNFRLSTEKDAFLFWVRILLSIPLNTPRVPSKILMLFFKLKLICSW